MKTPPIYFRRYHKDGDQTTQTEYNCPTQDTDWKKDQDIRYRKEANPSSQNSQNGNYNAQYSVPTSNRYETLNQGN